MTEGSKSITLDTYDRDTLGYLRAFPKIGDAIMRRVEDALLRGARLDIELAQAVRARNSAMRQRDEERAGKEGNIRALNAAIARAVLAEDAVARVEALIGNWESTKGTPESEAWTNYVAERVRNALSGDYSSEAMASDRA